MAALILIIIGFFIFLITKSDDSASEKAVLIVVVAVVGVIGGSFVAALIMASPLLMILVIGLIIVFAVTFFQGLFEDSLENKRFAKKNVTNQVASDAPENIIQQRLADIKVGDVIPFGKYQWKVLDVQGNEALLITDRVILKKELHHDSQARGAIWERCTLRKYLNGSFLARNFGPGEKSLILEKSIENKNHFIATPIPNTNDRIFLLSIPEAKKYRELLKCPITTMITRQNNAGCAIPTAHGPIIWTRMTAM